MPITIKEIKEKKRELEKEMLETLKSFEASTGLNIDSMSVTRLSGGNKKEGFLHSVNVEVKL